MTSLSSLEMRAVEHPDQAAMLAQVERWAAINSGSRNLAGLAHMADELADCFAALPGEMPDGICLDASGAVWVAVHGRVLRVAEGGIVLDEVDMGSTLGTAVALGGADGRTLLITASDSYDRSVMAGNPTGRLFTVQVDVPGAGLPSVY